MLAPLQIGPVRVDPPLLLAPMAGQTNHAFRRLVRELGGCGLVCTELISSRALENRGTRQRTMDGFDWSPQESPIAVQLFGCNPGEMAQAARVVAQHGADLVDVNMGCWVPKVARKGGGAALLRDPGLAREVVEAVVGAVSVPVTVKLRSGWDEGSITAVDFARVASAAGVKAVTVHARTAAQGFSGQADWSVIGRVKQVVGPIPVIGNGDVETAEQVRQMVALTGCDGVMLGRAVLGRPWLFSALARELATGERTEPPDLSHRAALALRHAELTLETTNLDRRRAVLEMRGQLSRYRLDPPGRRVIRDALVRVESPEEIRALLLPLMTTRPPEAQAAVTSRCQGEVDRGGRSLRP